VILEIFRESKKRACLSIPHIPTVRRIVPPSIEIQKIGIVGNEVNMLSKPITSE